VSRAGVLALVTAAFALGALAVLSVAPLAPFLLESLALSRVQVGLFIPAVYLGGVAMSVPAGWLTDRLGVRRTLALGQVVIGTFVLAASVAPRLPLVLLALTGAGFGFSVLNPATGKAIVEWFPPRRRGVAMGIKQTGLTLGGLLAALGLPPLAEAHGWRLALAAAATAALVSAAVVALVYRSPHGGGGAPPTERPRFADLKPFVGRPGVRVVLVSGFALSLAQSSVLAYLTLYARETFAVSAIVAGQLLALAQVGGTASRLVWGVVSDRFLGGRRRPGVVVSALVGAAAYATLAGGGSIPPALAGPLALVAGAAAFGWVGLYFALVAEIGGARYAGLLTGVAVAFAWSGMLLGPPAFGLLLEATGTYTLPWLLLATIGLTVAATLPRLPPLVQRGP
jgi:MFS family permease